MVSSNGGETPSYITSNGTLYICDDYFNPIKISEEVVDVSGGYLRGMYVKKDGSLMSWGRNDCGQLGNGTVTAFSKSTSPQQAVKVMDDVTKVSTSWSYSLAIKMMVVFGDGVTTVMVISILKPVILKRK